MIDDPAIVALLAEARAQFATGLPDKAAELGAMLARSAWAEARRAAHKLRGSAGTYGFAAISAAAAGIEEALIEASEPDRTVQARLGELAGDVRILADAAASGRTP